MVSPESPRNRLSGIAYPESPVKQTVPEGETPKIAWNQSSGRGMMGRVDRLSWQSMAEISHAQQSRNSLMSPESTGVPGIDCPWNRPQRRLNAIPPCPRFSAHYFPEVIRRRKVTRRAFR